jgi:sodium/potassium-transporting ATPase subunit alpha
MEKTMEKPEMGELKGVEENSNPSLGNILTVLLDFTDLEWHKLTVPELCRRFSVNPNIGLSDDQIKRYISEHDPNKTLSRPSGLLGKVLGYFLSAVGTILVVAGISDLFHWKPLGDPQAGTNMVLVCVLIAVWVVQAAFNACEDERVMASIDTMLTDECVVIRNGSYVGISARDLIPGDIVVVRKGDRLAGDVRFVKVSSAMFDRARLYGM